MYRGRDTLAAPIRPNQMTEQEVPWHPPRTLFQDLPNPDECEAFSESSGKFLERR
jgi:hypothetical protein